MRLLIILLFSSILASDWSIDTTYSYIKYTGNHPLHSWAGISKDINFKLNCDNDDCTISISTPLEKFDSGNDSRDSNMLYYTESLLYPIVSFESNEFIFNDKTDISIDLNGIIDFHGIEKEFPVKIVLTQEDETIRGICNFDIGLDLFNTERPSLLMIKISNTIKIEVNLNLLKINDEEKK